MYKLKMIWNFRILISGSKSLFWHIRQRIYLKNPKYWGTLIYKVRHNNSYILYKWRLNRSCWTQVAIDTIVETFFIRYDPSIIWRTVKFHQNSWFGHQCKCQLNRDVRIILTNPVYCLFILDCKYEYIQHWKKETDRQHSYKSYPSIFNNVYTMAAIIGGVYHSWETLVS